MSLEKPPPSRYRVEERNGLLIVHDSMSTNPVSSAAPVLPAAAAAQPRSALSGTSLTPNVSPNASPAPTAQASSMRRADSGGDATIAAGKAKRGAGVAAAGIGLVFFLFITGLWPIMAIAMLVPPMRKRLLAGVLPAVKRYIEEGRVS